MMRDGLGLVLAAEKLNYNQNALYKRLCQYGYSVGVTSKYSRLHTILNAFPHYSLGARCNLMDSPQTHAFSVEAN